VAYEGAAPSLVRAWKERGLRRLARVAGELVLQQVPPPAADLITFIPPDGDRSLRRGYQPAEQLARELASGWGISAGPALVRTRPVARQTGLTRRERRQNVRGAFVARPGLPSRVVLVDDVYTTGATVASAASALRTAGARRVEVVSFARVVR
jgi:predicted amidophosphoribosyltransferase